MPSFVKSAIKGIKKYPEIFSALEEFEKTKRIRKFSYRKRLDITIDEQMLNKFKKYCREKGLNMSRLIESYIKKEIS
ncbi:TPA: hypothetical protein HA219_03015 [Candidatus Woesearchaeota archaeon]|nr:hypothetical protein [Candidatus Woesearchaeota archaeon]HIH39664.1 hypothetical protein [Candidatus Woesearchaeota archaeon]